MNNAVTPPTCLAPGLDDRCEAWTAIYGPDEGYPITGALEAAAEAVVSPDGATLFVTGRANDPAVDQRDYATIAYDALTGAERWIARDGGDRLDAATGIAVDPHGERLYVSGITWVPERGGEYRYATIAYRAATGERLWRSEWGAGRQLSQAFDVAVSPDGERVYVTGESYDLAGSSFDVATVAHAAATGEEVWSAVYGTGGRDGGVRVAVSPDGRRVFVTGNSAADYVTLAYEAADTERLGEQLWEARYGTPPVYEEAVALGVGPDGSRVFVTGVAQTGAGADSYDAATLAYDATTGAGVWEARYRTPGVGGHNGGTSLVVNAAREAVHVGGFSANPGDPIDWDVVAITYDLGTGAQRWASGYGLRGWDWEVALSAGISADGERVYIGGFSTGTFQFHPVDYVTLAFDAAMGAQVWAARDNPSPAHADFNWMASMAVSPVGRRVFTTGTQTTWLDVEGNQRLTDYDFRTVAYEG